MTDTDPKALLRNARALVNARKSKTDHPHRVATELAARGDFEGAVEAFTRAVQESPEAPWTHLGLGDALVELGRHDEARDAYSQALNHTPKSALALLDSIGAGLAKVGDFDAAERVFRSNLTAESDRPSTKVALARVLLSQGAAAQSEAGSLLATVESDDVDRSLISAALGVNPRNPGLLRLMAKSFGARHEYERAIAMLHLALTHDPDDRASVVLLGETLTAHAPGVTGYLEPEPDANHPFAPMVLQSFEIVDRAFSRNQSDLDLACARAKISDLLPGGQRVAAESWRSVTALDPDVSSWQREFGDRLAAIGEFEAAGAAYDRAIALGYEVF